MKIFLQISIFFLLSSSAANAAEKRIVVIGDSIAAGFEISKEKAFPALLETRLKAKGHAVKVVNASISGSTTASALSRLKWQTKQKIDILILELGANDGLRGHDVKAAKENLANTIKLAKSKNIKVLLTGMQLPRNMGKEYHAKFVAIFPELAKEHKIALMPYLLKGVGGVPSLNLPDRIHPNEKGHLIIVKNIQPYVEKLL